MALRRIQLVTAPDMSDATDPTLCRKLPAHIEQLFTMADEAEADPCAECVGANVVINLWPTRQG